MASATTSVPLVVTSSSSNVSPSDLWKKAVDSLDAGTKTCIDLNDTNKIHTMSKIDAEVTKWREKCEKERWRIKRKNGDVVILRDVFSKLVRWIDDFKKVGDTIIQYDPVHAALPWAGVRLILQIAVNDHQKWADMIESVAWISGLIARYAAVEHYYMSTTGFASDELNKALLKLYTAILVSQSNAIKYMRKNAAVKMLKGVLSSTSIFKKQIIQRAQDDVEQCLRLVDRDMDNCAQEQILKELKSIRDRVDAPPNRSARLLETIRDGLGVGSRNKILEWLSSEPHLRHHNDSKKDVLEDTGQWLLSDPVFKEWKNGSTSSIFWLHGPVGSGKSKLVSIIIEDALEDYRGKMSPHPAFFYCVRNMAEPARSNPEQILRSILKQLSTLQPGSDILDPVVRAYKEGKKTNHAAGPLQIEESCRLIIQLTASYPLSIIVIDALDECDPDTRDDLIKSFEKIVTESTNLVKIFVSSRDDLEFKESFRDCPGLETGSTRNSEDLANFVKWDIGRKMARRGGFLSQSSAKEELRQLIVDKITEGASGMFLWASLQLDYISSLEKDKDIRKRLGQLPHKLRDVYHEMYRKVLSDPKATARNRTFKSTLIWLMVAQRTLSADELLAAVSFNPETGYDQETKDQLLQICNNFVVFDDEMEVFRFAHLSVREFLESQFFLNENPEFTAPVSNALAAEICLLTHIANMPNPTSEKFLLNRGILSEGLHHDPQVFSKYSYAYWGDHCRLASSARKYGSLKETLAFFLSNENDSSSALARFMVELPNMIYETRCLKEKYMRQDQQGHRLPPPIQTSKLKRFKDCWAEDGAKMFIASVFDLSEVFEPILISIEDIETLRNCYGRSVWELCIRHNSLETISALLQLGTTVTEPKLVMAVSSPVAIKLLFDTKDIEFDVTMNILSEAARTSTDSLKVILNERQFFEFSDDVLVAAMVNPASLSLLLDQGTKVKVTNKVLLAATREPRSFRVLWDKRSTEIEVREGLLVIAAQEVFEPDMDFDKGLMSTLMATHREELVITEKVLLAAARSPSRALILEALLDNKEFDVTQKVINEILEQSRMSKDTGSNEIMMKCLERWKEVQYISQDILETIAQVCDSHVMALALRFYGVDRALTSAILTAAASNEYSAVEMLDLLLDWEPKIGVTQDVLKSAVQNRRMLLEATTLLLDREPTLRLTDDVIDLALSHSFLFSAPEARDRTKEICKIMISKRPEAHGLFATRFQHYRHGFVVRFFITDSWIYFKIPNPAEVGGTDVRQLSIRPK